jgi:uncharacterized protein with GYD domain
MALYMVQFAYTAEALAAMAKNPQDCSVPVKELLQKLGGRMIGFYYCFGEYDGVALVELPDDSAATALALAAVSPGHLKKSVGTAPLGGGQYGQLSHSLDSMVDSPYPSLYKRAFPSPHFKQRGSLRPFMCSCSCSWSASCSLWRCFGVIAGSIFSLPIQEVRPLAPQPNASSSHAPRWTAPVLATCAVSRMYGLETS